MSTAPGSEILAKRYRTHVDHYVRLQEESDNTFMESLKPVDFPQLAAKRAARDAVQRPPDCPDHVAYEEVIIRWLVRHAGGNYGELRMFRGYDPYTITHAELRDGTVRKLPRGCMQWLTIVNPETNAEDPELARAVVDDIHRRIHLNPASRVVFLRDGPHLAPILRTNRAAGAEDMHHRGGCEFVDAPFGSDSVTLTADGKPIYSNLPNGTGKLIDPRRYFVPQRAVTSHGSYVDAELLTSDWEGHDFPDLPPPPPPGRIKPTGVIHYPWEEDWLCDQVGRERPGAGLPSQMQDMTLGTPEWCESVNLGRYLERFGPFKLTYTDRAGNPDRMAAVVMRGATIACLGLVGLITMDTRVTDHSLEVGYVGWGNAPDVRCPSDDDQRPGRWYSMFETDRAYAQRAYYWTMAPGMPWNTAATLNVDTKGSCYRTTVDLLRQLQAATVRTDTAILTKRKATAEEAEDYIATIYRAIGFYGSHFLNVDLVEGNLVTITHRRWGLDPLPQPDIASRWIGAEPLPDQRIPRSLLAKPCFPRELFDMFNTPEIRQHMASQGFYSLPNTWNGYPIEACIEDRPRRMFTDSVDAPRQWGR